MANLPLTEIVVPGSQDVLELAPDLSAEVSALQSAVNTLNTEVSSIPNGTYPELTAGSILSESAYSKDTTPYLYRAMPYVSKRLEDVLVGGSVVWNQLCNATSVTITSGHKYYMKKDGTETVGASDGTALTGLTVGTDIVRDLTQMLGSTIADYINSLGSTDGVAFLKRYFITIGVYDSYDTGTIKSVEATAHVTRGVNAWDEEWELGTYSTTTGEPSSSSTQIRCKNYIPVLPSTSYYVAGLTSGIMRPVFYDAAKNFISVGYWQGGTSNNPQATPENARYMRFYLAAAYGTTYKNDICINISDPTINGKYFPYEEHTYNLGDVPLYGLFQLENNKLKAYGDVRHAEGGTDRKFRLVTFDGTEAGWQWADAFKQAYISLPANAKYVDADYIPNIVCKLKVVAGNNRLSNIYNFVALVGGGASIAFSAPNCDTLEQFKTWASNNNLTAVYELATPTTETTTPFEQYQVCTTGGTEEYTTTNDVPVGHDTKYFTDVIGNIEDIPAPPTADGTYTLKVTVSSGVPTYAWV